MITIIYEDVDIAVVHKPTGLASQATAFGNNSISSTLPETWQPVHRLDQRVSGLVLLAKNTESFTVLSKAFANRQVNKKYRAVVANQPLQASATLIHWLLKNGKQQKVKAFSKAVAHSVEAQLSYVLVLSSLKYHLLDITLVTGRFHQIRAQLAAINCAIVGDVKYGYKRTTPDGSIFLQSYYLAFKHPATKAPLHFEINMPELWHKYGL
ncbi:MAG: RluA family pseudouridine synthase [Flavobacterium sp.]|nr:RluA family pseudouridine synthase [Flavobacterium sp.]